ncbi:MAG: YbhB/YbcL family Raf kinase inhibitor-like protein [Desulfobaccales bacterium]
MQITSSAFQDGAKIPLQFVMPGAGGKNVSVPLAWSNIPAGTQSLALSMVDPHPVAGNWVHWLVIDLPKDAASLPQGASGRTMPQGAVELKNSFGDLGYGGPQPPRGSGDHPYVFTLYALSVPKVELPKNAGLAAFKQALKDKTLATATLTGYFGR